MLGNLRKLINMFIFILLAPLIGYEEATREIARGGRREDTHFLAAMENVAQGLRKREIEYDLIEAARCYEYSGMGHDAYFEYLYSYVSLKLEDLRRSLPEYYIAVLTSSVGISIASVLLLLLSGALPALISYTAAVTALIILIHRVQPQIAEYRYAKALALAAVVFSVMIILRAPIDIAVAVSCACASLAILPEIAETFKMLLNSQARLILPFLELLWSATPTPIRARTLLEKELQRLWSYGYNIGAPWLIARLCRLVTVLVQTIKYLIRMGLVYAPFVMGSYVFLLLLSKTVLIGAITVKLPGAIMINKTSLQILLLAQGILTGLLTGKTAHSIGVSTLTIPIALIMKLVLLGPANII